MAKEYAINQKVYRAFKSDPLPPLFFHFTVHEGHVVSPLLPSADYVAVYFADKYLEGSFEKVTTFSTQAEAFAYGLAHLNTPKEDGMTVGNVGDVAYYIEYELKNGLKVPVSIKRGIIAAHYATEKSAITMPDGKEVVIQTIELFDTAQRALSHANSLISSIDTVLGKARTSLAQDFVKHASEKRV